MTSFLSLWHPTSTALAATATILLIIVSAFKLTRLHARLSTLVKHESHVGEAAQEHIRSLPSPTINKPQDPSVLPEALITNLVSFGVLHDAASLAVSASQLPLNHSPYQLLVTYLRHNLALFRGFRKLMPSIS